MRAPALLLSLAVGLTAVPSSLTAAAQGVDAEVVVDGLEFPAGIAFTSDGRMLVTERPGRVRIVQDGRLQDRPLAEIPVTTAGETGLLGIAVDPGGRAAFVFATEPDGDSNSVWRIPLDRSEGPERVITDLPAAGYHNGGGVAFDDDGMLLVSNGEQHSGYRAQDPDALGGKVYRFTPTGTVPGDNPFDGSAALATGLRNPFGLTIDPVTGTAWVTENGPESWDEINRVVPGGNHGWPVISGPLDEGVRGSGSFGPGDYQDPALAFEQVIVPTGIAFAGPDASPEHQDLLFFGGYQDATVRRATLNPDRDGIEDDDVLLQEDSPVVAVSWGPEGLYYSTRAGAVKVIPMTDRERASPSAPQGTSPPAASPSVEDERPVTDETSGSSWWWIVAVAGGLLLGYLGMRRGVRR